MNKPDPVAMIFPWMMGLVFSLYFAGFLLVAVWHQDYFAAACWFAAAWSAGLVAAISAKLMD